MLRWNEMEEGGRESSIHKFFQHFQKEAGACQIQWTRNDTKARKRKKFFEKSFIHLPPSLSLSLPLSISLSLPLSISPSLSLSLSLSLSTSVNFDKLKKDFFSSKTFWSLDRSYVPTLRNVSRLS